MSSISPSGKAIVDDRDQRLPLRGPHPRDPVSFRLRGRSFFLIKPESTLPAIDRSLMLRRQLAKCEPFPRHHMTWKELCVQALMVVSSPLIPLAFVAALGMPIGLGCGIPFALLGVLATTHRFGATDGDFARLHGLPPVCLACGYDLDGVPPASDGCQICPECGGAWRIARDLQPDPDDGWY